MAKETSDTPQEDNPLANLAFNIVLPVMILNNLSAEERLGPVWALVVAMALPIGYGIYDFVTRRTFNFFSVLGLIGVLATGIFGLLKTDPIWFACKEAALPSLIGIFFIVSHKLGKPFVKDFFLNPQLVDTKKIQRRLEERGTEDKLDGLVWKCTLGMAGAMFFSGIASFFIALWVLKDVEPGSEAYVKAIGKTIWVGLLAVGIPMIGGMLLLFWRLCKGLEKITGLDWDDLTTQGETRTRTVKKGQAKEASESETKSSETD